MWDIGVNNKYETTQSDVKVGSYTKNTGNCAKASFKFCATVVGSVVCNLVFISSTAKSFTLPINSSITLYVMWQNLLLREWLKKTLPHSIAVLSTLALSVPFCSASSASANCIFVLFISAHNWPLHVTSIFVTVKFVGGIVTLTPFIFTVMLGASCGASVILTPSMPKLFKCISSITPSSIYCCGIVTLLVYMTTVGMM